MKRLRRNATAGLIAAMLAAVGTSAGAQAPNTDDTAKLLHCRENANELYWLTREQLRTRCGIWSSTYTVKTASGPVERIVYSRYFVVTLRNGQVSSVRQRRHIFTGFKKHP